MLSDQIQRVFDTKWFSIDSVKVKDDNEPYYRINFPGGVVVLPVTVSGNLVVVKQYRPLLERYTIEMPAGAIEEGETAIEAAQRELYEETGYRTDTLIHVGEGVLRIDREDVINHFFVAVDAKFDSRFIPEEDISTIDISPREFRQLVINQRFDHMAALPVFLLSSWRKGINLV